MYDNGAEPGSGEWNVFLLVDKCYAWGLFPNTDGANAAARNGYVKVLECLETLGPQQRRVFLNTYGANWTAVNGRLEMLKWLAAYCGGRE